MLTVKKIIEDIRFDGQDISKSAYKDFCLIIEKIKAQLYAGNSVTIMGLGQFRIKDQQPRVAFNMKTKEKIEVPAKKVIKFKPNVELRQYNDTITKQAECEK